MTTMPTVGPASLLDLITAAPAGATGQVGSGTTGAGFAALLAAMVGSSSPMLAGTAAPPTASLAAATATALPECVAVGTADGEAQDPATVVAAPGSGPATEVPAEEEPVATVVDEVPLTDAALSAALVAQAQLGALPVPVPVAPVMLVAAPTAEAAPADAATSTAAADPTTGPSPETTRETTGAPSLETTRETTGEAITETTVGTSALATAARTSQDGATATPADALAPAPAPATIDHPAAAAAPESPAATDARPQAHGETPRASEQPAGAQAAQAASPAQAAQAAHVTQVAHLSPRSSRAVEALESARAATGTEGTAGTAGVSGEIRSESGPTQRTEVVTRQVFPEVVRLAGNGNGTHRVALRLDPGTLGEVRVVLTVRNGEVNVRIAANSEARDMLAESAPELRRLLEQVRGGEARISVADLLTGANATSYDGRSAFEDLGGPASRHEQAGGGDRSDDRSESQAGDQHGSRSQERPGQEQRGGPVRTEAAAAQHPATRGEQRPSRLDLSI